MPLHTEELRDLIGSYHANVTEQVRRFDGFVANYMGDGVLAYFGYPQAHEDDAERTVNAALALIDQIGGLGGTLQVRIGISTGLVVVGDLLASEGRQKRDAVGETLNLAARLQAIAQPNSVIICQTTRRLLGDLFEYRDLGAVELRLWCSGTGVAGAAS